MTLCLLWLKFQQLWQLRCQRSFTICMIPRLPNIRAAILLMPNCQHAGTKASVKTVSASSVETKSEEEGAVVKSKLKQDNKICAQSSQIKDLCTKLGPSSSQEFPNQGISESNFSAKGIYKCLASC